MRKSLNSWCRRQESNLQPSDYKGGTRNAPKPLAPFANRSRYLQGISVGSIALDAVLPEVCARFSERLARCSESPDAAP